MAILYMNKYVGTYDPGNTKQNVLATDLVGAVALLVNSIEGVGVEPIMIQKTDTNVAVSVPDEPVIP